MEYATAELNFYERTILGLASNVLFKRFLSGARNKDSFIKSECRGVFNDIEGKWVMHFSFVPDEEK